MTDKSPVLPMDLPGDLARLAPVVKDLLDHANGKGHGPFVTLYLGVFEYRRLYGGPEEGGWWYDAGEVQEFHPFRLWWQGERFILSKDELTALDVIWKDIESEYEFGTHYQSNASPRGPDYYWEVSTDVPESYPDQKPIYQ